MRPDGVRCWVAEVCYPHKKSCWFGTVPVDLNATMTEVEAAVRSKALEHLPEGFDVVQLVPGYVFLRLEEKGDR